MYVRTDKGDAICPPPIINGGGIKIGVDFCQTKTRAIFCKSAIGYYSTVCSFITHLVMTQIWTKHG